VIAVALLLAWLIRFGCDDAYITFTYARSLVRGDGLTWFGNHVEGYTNFAWVLWIALGLVASVDPLLWAWLGSLAAMAAVIAMTYRLAARRTGSTAAAVAAGALLATNFTFLAFGTSGLETMLQAALVTAALLLVDTLRRAATVTPRSLVAMSLVSGLALWTRLDSAVPIALLGAVALHRARTPRNITLLIAPAALLVGGWLVWKLAYYGDIVPNTFHAKVAMSTATLGGAVRFAGAFLHAYLLWPLLAAVAGLALARRRFSARLPAALVAVWLAYVVLVGGDFMEFRFFVPIMPALFLVLAETLVERDRLRALALVAFCTAFSWRHAATFEGVDDRYYDSVHNLGTYYGMVTDGDWSKLGTSLRETFAGTDVTLACNGAGAVPYYADLPTVDQLGLNDRWVARHGTRPAPDYVRPGHQRFATYEYLLERKVTFVIGSPKIIEAHSLKRDGLTPAVQGWLASLLGASPLTAPALVVVGAPVAGGGQMLMWYLTPDPEVTARIRAAGWEMTTLHRR